MIYITGDLHGSAYLRKLSKDNFQEQVDLDKEDYVIIAGDFGGVWNNSEEELELRDWLDKRSFTTLFIDGNHENFDLLNSYPEERWKGGAVHRIGKSILHLKRGQVFEIDGYRIFTFGGAASIDKNYRIEGVSWWKEEIPSVEEQLEGIQNLDEHDWQVDFVVSHTCPSSILDLYMETTGRHKEHVDYTTEEYLEMVKNKLSYEGWFFGHYHEDMTLDSKHILLFEDILNLDWVL